MGFIRNCWYVAAWDKEVVAGEVLARRIADESIVFFRETTGVVKALHGVCPHRLAPLARGKCVGDTLQCSYHGLQFGGDGKCVKNPFGAVPPGLNVRSYPVVERHKFVWVWTGDAAKADEALIPDFSFHDEGNSVDGGYMHFKAGYLLGVDNLLDVGHIEFLHPTTLGTGKVVDARHTVEQQGEVVWSKLDTKNEEFAEGVRLYHGTPEGVLADRMLYTRWEAPGNMVLFLRAVPAGRPYEENYMAANVHVFTPETDTTTHYFYGASLPNSVPNAALMVADQVAFLKIPFGTEDKPVLEDQQLALGDRDLMDMKLAWLAGDAGSARARKIVREKMAAEAAAR